jgi:hypothetical protein
MKQVDVVLSVLLMVVCIGVGIDQVVKIQQLDVVKELKVK